MGFRFSGRGPSDTDRVDLGLIAEVRAYWEALRRGEMLPRRDQVDPRGIANALEHTFLIERIGPGLARFRIAGMAYNDLMGMDIRGMPLSCLFLGEGRIRLQMEMERMFRGPSILTLTLQAERGLGRPAMSARMCLLPMLGHKGGCDLAIGCIELGGEIGRSPRRFAISDAQLEAIATRRMATDKASPEPAFSEDESLYIPPPRATPGVPHLRLVKG